MAQEESSKIVEVCNIEPIHETTESFQSPTSLPLTFFDLLWLRFPPVERLFFYEFTKNSTISFYDSILPNLKHSLSLTLQHFLPLAGNIIWPNDSSKPIINYVLGDSVSFTVVESKASFKDLSSNHCDASQRYHLIPLLKTSHEKASLVSIQVTLFPNFGFCIGITTHHATFDGNSSTIFMKSWAYTCSNLIQTLLSSQPNSELVGLISPENQTLKTEKNTCFNFGQTLLISQQNSQSTLSSLSLPKELTPFWDRSVIQDSNGISEAFVDAWMKHGGPNNRSLKVWDFSSKVKNDKVKRLFQLTPSNIQKLKEHAQNEMKNKVHLSTFSVTCAYMLSCLAKAEQPKVDKVIFIFSVDCRTRLDPPISPMYFGNCIAGQKIVLETKDLVGKNGFFVALEGINESLKRVKDGEVLNGAKNWLSYILEGSESTKIYSIAGSPRFEVYGIDFGFGKPKKVDMTSIDKTGAFSLSERNDDNGGIEIGLALSNQQIQDFSTLFVQGLESI
ncbi:phenolic glucoside malonyltransferase 1-like [Cicer arietinum]|uniref:Malonyl-coenzyme A:anthocyanin 3-O-glucoside-6''-O-malonyltransferase-like n=1 Tax=Cicer arietinum TaxID=3827 RepID=A0A1S2YN71_CICAR|nr:malonyl-coenzyme A:anthocyanin 3-O-glucoside-6''-O-malonyltransferase-like [Cicer arietinum]